MKYPLSLLRNIVVATGLFALAGTGLTGSTASAQANYGEIDGTVKDATGALVANAKVTVTSESTGVKVSAVTNASGDFRAPNLLPADYEVRVEAPGFQTFVEHHLTVSVGRATAAPVTVSVSGTSTAVEVDTEAGSALDTTTQNLTTNIGAQELNILPIAAAGGFGALNVSLLAPNVASPGGIGIGTGPSIGGQRPRNNNYTIEGIDDNDKSVTGPIITVPNDATGEFTLIANQFSPEFGHSSGGQFSTTITSGTNKFHGKLYEYFQNRDLNAASGIAGGKTPNTRFDANRYGGQLGGPIKRDKLFFFSNFERFTVGQSLSYFLCTPTAAGITTLNGLATSYGFRQTNLTTYTSLTPAANVNGGAQVTDANDNACFDGPGAQFMTVTNGGAASTKIPLGNAYMTPASFSNQDQSTSSVDFTPNEKNSFRFRYVYFTEGFQDTTAQLPIFHAPIPYREHLASFGWFHNFTPSLINELRVGFNREFFNYPVAGPSFPGLNAFPNIYLYDVGLDIGPDDNAPQSTIQNFYQVVDNITWTKGKHTIAFGFDGRKYISPQNFVQRQRGDYEWAATDYYLHDLAPDQFGERSAGAQNYAGDQTAFYGYFNDTWKASPKFTLNYGLRYEFTSVPSGQRQQAVNNLASVPGLIAFTSPQPQYKNFAPRVGFIFAPDDKTSIRAGFGMAYDVLFDNLGILSLPPQFSQTNDVGNTAAGQPDYLSPNFLANGGLSANLTPITTAASARKATAAYIPNQVLPYTETWNLTIQRQVAKNYTVELQYVGTHGVHLPVQSQLNKTPKVTAANALTTYAPGANSLATDAATGYTYAYNTSATAKLSNITALSAILPAFNTNGFTSSITSYQPYGGSNYNGLGVNVTRRFVNGLQMNASYTYSRAMDDSTAEINASDLTQRRPMDSQNMHQEYSRSALDRPNRFTLEAVYDLPYFKHSNFLLRNTLGNWLLSPVYTYETGEFVTPSSETNANLNGDSAAISRTLYYAGAPKGTGSGVYPVFNTATPTAACLALLTATTSANGVASASNSACASQVAGYQMITNAQYVTAGPGTLPNAQRNTLSSRPIDNLTMSAGKKISINERYSLEVQALAFNLLNHAQYVPGNIDTIGSTATAGEASNYLDPSNATGFNRPDRIWSNHARSMQLVAKFNF